MQLSVFDIGRILRRLSCSIKAYANLLHLNERKKYLLSVKNCLCQNRNMFPTCQGNVVHTTASLPHFTVPTGARLTRNIAQSSAVGALCVRLHGGVWGGLCPPLSSPGRLYLATFANLVADRTAVWLNSGFCAAAVYLRQPFNITSASYHQALEHCQAQKPLNTIITFPTRLQTTSKMSSF